MRFQDKVAIVTAAASGIGKATSRILASEGAHLVAVDVNARALAALVEEIDSAGGNISTVEANVCLLYTSDAADE